MKNYSMKSIKEDFKNKGIFYTPEKLALYLKSLLPDKVDKIYDPTCGNGGLLSVFEDDVIKYGQDILEEQLEVAKNKMKNFNGYLGDTLKDPAFKDIKFDYIVANPPFSIEWEPSIDERFEKAPTIPTKGRADYAFLLHILYYLTDKGKAIVLQFPGVLYRGNREYTIRKWMLEQNYIEQIIRIPGDTFEDTKIETCIIVFNKDKKNTDVLFKDEEKEYKATFEEIQNNNYDLSVSHYIVEEVEEEKIDIINIEYEARKSVLKQIEGQLEFSLLISRFENLDMSDLLEDIEKIVKKYKEKIKELWD